MSGVAIYTKESIVIGDDCLIGANVKIYDFSDSVERLGNPTEGKTAPVI